MLKLVWDSILKVGRSLGYDIVPLREMGERDFALHLGELLARLRIDCVLDVGANVGQYHDFLRDTVRFEGTIVSFEPARRHVGQLRERARTDPDWHIEPYALGARSESLTINVMTSDRSSAALPCRIETVTVKTLDSVLPALSERLGIRRPYLKLDTQGFDIEVMEGARDCLPAIHALQSEAAVLDSDKGMPGYRDTIHYLGARGFDLTGLYSAKRDRSLRLVECDCVMINRASMAT